MTMTSSLPMLDLKAMPVGEHLPTSPLPALTKADFENFMRAGDEFHPIHSDVEYARAAGMKDIVVPGLLLLAHMSRYLTGCAPRDRVREFGARFVGVSYPSDALTVGGTLLDRFETDGETRVRLDLRISDQDAAVKVRGDAVVAVC